MNNFKKQVRRAFTIVELVIVIAVIAVLAAVLIPTFINVVNSADNSVDEQAVYNMNIILAAEKTTNGGTLEVGDAIDVLVENGYSDTFETYFSENTLKWDNEQNVVVIYNTVSNTVTFPADYVQSSTATLYNLSASSSANGGFAAGDGTSESTAYEITTVSQLESLRTLINSGEGATSGVYFKLSRDLDLGDDWLPLGNTFYTQAGSSSVNVYSLGSKIFNGTFDGNSKTITMNDTTAVDSESDYALFSFVGAGATIKNLNVYMNINDEEGVYSCGAVASYVSGDGTSSITFENITVTGTIKARIHAGGVVGWCALGCQFINCINRANITTTSGSGTEEVGKQKAFYSCIGGISAMAGYYLHADGSADRSTLFKNCANYGTLTHAAVDDTTHDYYSQIGNMAGKSGGSDSGGTGRGTLTFEDCICAGKIYGTTCSSGSYTYYFEGYIYGTDPLQTSYTGNTPTNQYRLLIGGNSCDVVVIEDSIQVYKKTSNYVPLDRDSSASD